MERVQGGHWLAEDVRNDRRKVWSPGGLAVAKRWALWSVTGAGREPLGAVRTQLILAGPCVGQ